MTHGSLFSGIGGFDLAAEWAGWENKFHCEWNEFGQRVLKYYWPNAVSYGDITKTDFTVWRGRIDVLTGGFPCQPYSVAGKRKGKEDERHLWPEMLRAIQEIQPTYIVGENVPGLINWNGGLVFDEVQTDLEAEGYEVIPFILPAAGVNAPHRRDRVWFIAYANDKRGSAGLGQIQGENGEIPERNEDAKFINAGAGIMAYSENRRTGRLRDKVGEERTCSCNELLGECCGLLHNDGINANTSDLRLQGSQFHGSIREEREESKDKQPIGLFRTDWENFPTQSPICNGDDGLSSRLAGITFPKFRNESIKAGGNAVVPQIPYQIFKAINEFDLNFNTNN